MCIIHRSRVLGQYREVGVLVWRNASLDMLMRQCLSADTDAGKGRQMPVVSSLLLIKKEKSIWAD